jgi:hypothetical protein
MAAADSNLKAAEQLIVSASIWHQLIVFGIREQYLAAPSAFGSH